MKRLLSLFSLLLIAVAQSWAVEPEPEAVQYVQLYENGPMWATMNLGATSVTDAGLYFWWGDVEGHAKGDEFVFASSNKAITSYENYNSYEADGKLIAEKDAATQQLGAAYRMPTQAEFEDLKNKCDWTWQTDYNGIEGVNGYLVTGKNDYVDNSIFLPAAGYNINGSLDDEGIYGIYWSSSRIQGATRISHSLYFSSSTVKSDNDNVVYFGFPIRPVYEDPAQTAYNYLVSLIGEKKYAYMYYQLSVSETSAIQIRAMGEGIDLPVNDLSVSGNEYLFQNYGIKFVVEDEAIAHIYLMMGDVAKEEFSDISSTFADEAQLADLIGDDVYIGGGSQIFASEGMVMFMESGGVVPMSLSAMGILTKDEDDDYLYQLGEVDILFVVEDGELTNIAMLVEGEPYKEFVKQVVTLVGQITIGENTEDYSDWTSFVQAFYDIDVPAYVTLLDDITLPNGSLINNTNSGADITLDLNGHSITGNVDGNDILRIENNAKLTIVGEGVVENLGVDGLVIGGRSSVVINQGTYIGNADICFVGNGHELIINGGEFKATALYYLHNGFIRPIVYGGIFSMDPSDCVAEGYEVIDNDDEETKDEYPYKVVEKSLIPTAIENINADKSQKAIKTIENGKVVIIRGDKKFDLSGIEL